MTSNNPWSAAINSPSPLGPGFFRNDRCAKLAAMGSSVAKKEQKMWFQQTYLNRKFLLLPLTLLAFAGFIFQARVVVGAPTPKRTDGHRHDEEALPLISFYSGSNIDRERNEQETYSINVGAALDDRLKQQQERERRGWTPERLTYRLRSSERNSDSPGMRSLPAQQPRAPQQSVNSQRRATLPPSEAGLNEQQLRLDFQRVNQSTTQHLQGNSIHDAFAAHLEHTLANARLEGALVERERLEQLERMRIRDRQSSENKREKVKLLEDIVRRETLEQGSTETALPTREPAKNKRLQGGDRAETFGIRDNLEQELLERQRLERQRLDAHLREAERMEKVRAKNNRLSQEAQERRNREKEAQERNRLAKERQEKDRLKQQTQEIEREERIRAEKKRLEREEKEEALRAKQKLERERKERERLERYIMEHLLLESKREERTRQERVRRERETQQLKAFQEKEKAKADSARQEILEKERKQKEQVANELLAYAQIEAEVLEEMAEKVKMLQSQILQQELPIALNSAKHELNGGAPTPAAQAALNEGIKGDIDQLWETFQTLVHYTHGSQGHQDALQPTWRANVTGPQAPATPQPSEKQNQAEYREPLYQQQSQRATQPKNREPSSGVASHSRIPQGRSNTIVKRNSDEIIASLVSSVDNAASSAVANSAANDILNKYRNSNITVSIPTTLYNRALNSTEDNVKEQRVFNSSTAVGLPESETADAFIYNLLPKPHSESTHEVTSTVPSKLQNLADHEQQLELLSTTPSAANLNAAVPEASESLEDGEAESGLESLEGALTGTGHSGTVVNPLSDKHKHNATDETMKVHVARIEASRDSPAADPRVFHGASASEIVQNNDEVLKGLRYGGKSSSLRGLAGIRKRTRYGQGNADSDGGNTEFEETRFPVVHLDVSSSRPPPPGLQVPWPGYQPSQRSERMRSSHSRNQASQRTDYANTPYRTYMNFANPFSSAYSTHSYREDYGKRYSNEYYHDAWPRKVISWPQYVRRRDEKKELERRRKQEENEPKIGVIESASVPRLGVLEPRPRTSVTRPSYTPSQSRTSYTSQPAIATPSQRRRPNLSWADVQAPVQLRTGLARTRTTFTPYSSIANARAVGGSRFYNSLQIG